MGKPCRGPSVFSQPVINGENAKRTGFTVPSLVMPAPVHGQMPEGEFVL